jgi:Arc/MetJ-type ribon-helix-helix transcriptional regulator
MSDADSESGGDGPEMVQINLRLSEAFLEDIDATWKDQGFNSRSEFLRYAARDAVKHPEFSRERTRPPHQRLGAGITGRSRRDDGPRRG